VKAAAAAAAAAGGGGGEVAGGKNQELRTTFVLAWVVRCHALVLVLVHRDFAAEMLPCMMYINVDIETVGRSERAVERTLQ